MGGNIKKLALRDSSSLQHGKKLVVGRLGVVLGVEGKRFVVRAVHVFLREPGVSVGEPPRLKRAAVGVIETGLHIYTRRHAVLNSH